MHGALVLRIQKDVEESSARTNTDEGIQYLDLADLQAKAAIVAMGAKALKKDIVALSSNK